MDDEKLDKVTCKEPRHTSSKSESSRRGDLEENQSSKNKANEKYNLLDIKPDLYNIHCFDASNKRSVSQVDDVQDKEESDVIDNGIQDDETSGEKLHEVHTRLVIKETTETEKTEFRWRNMNRKQILILTAINFSYLLAHLNYSLPAPLFPKEANEKGVNSTITGWIFGVFALVQFIVSPFYRRLLPILGCKSLLMLGLFLCGGGTICFGLLTYIETAKSIFLYVLSCFVTRILLAMSCTLIDNTGLVMLVQYFPENVATLMGVGEIFTGVGYAGGPALGALLYIKGGNILPYTVTGGLALLALPFYCYFLPKENVTLKLDDTDLPISKLILHPVSLVNSIVIVITAISWSVLDPTLEPHLRENGLLPETIGIMFLVMAAFYSVTSPIWGRLTDLLLEKRILIIIGMLLAVLGFVLIGPSPVLGFSLKYNYVWYTAISLGTIGAASSMCVISTYSIYVNVLRAIGFPENTKSYGMVSGLWVSMYSLGWFIGPCLGGFLLDHIGFEWLVTWVAVACLATGLLVCVSLLAERKCCRKSYFYRVPSNVTEDHNLPIDSDIKAGLVTSQNL